jgi:transposase
LHRARSEELIEQRLKLIAEARPLTHDHAVIAPAVMQVQMFVEMLRVQEKHITRFDERIAELFAAHPAAAFFRQLPGAGANLAPRLLVAFGDDLKRYPNAASLQKYAGVAPVRERSGQRQWTHWRWHAPIFLRQSFVEWAGQTVVYCAWAKAYYRQQRRAGKAHQSILRSLAFKWIRILWRCWQNHEPYDDARYVAELRRRNSPLIALIESQDAAA